MTRRPTSTRPRSMMSLMRLSGVFLNAARTNCMMFLVGLALIGLSGTVMPGQKVLFREDFSSLKNWTPFYFPKITRHSLYSIEHLDGLHVLRTESDASASAIIHKISFNVNEYPRVRWRWKIRNVYAKGDPRTREGDDYPLRVYILFEYDPARAGVLDRMKYALAKAIFGAYPPLASLNYVWGNRDDPARIMTSPYTDRAKNILLQKGADKAGTWQDEEVDVPDDYRKAFGTEPPARARLAIMNDSDNTGERSVSWVEYIEVMK